MIDDALDKVGRKVAAADLGVATATLSTWTDDASFNGRAMPVQKLDQLARMHRASAAVVAQHFAALAGGYFVALPDPDAGEISAGFADMTRQFGDLSAEFMASFTSESDDPVVITRRDAKRILPEAADMSALLSKIHGSLMDIAE